MKKNIRRITTPTGRVRIDMDNDSHIAWLAKRWISGERQKDIGRSLGYSAGAIVCFKIACFIVRWGDRSDISTHYGYPLPTNRGLDRHESLKRALQNFYNEKKRRGHHER